MIANYLKSVRGQFLYYKSLAEKTFDQVPDDKLFWQYDEVNNSISTIVKHLSGNMLSRWTNFLSTDGEKDFRNRDSEFENDIKDRNEMMKRWDEGWASLFKALDSITEDNFKTTVYIRNQGHTITEAINRQLAHYAYHTGQIVLLGKIITGTDWKSLSIPKGKSKEFNQQMFSKK